MSRATKMSSNEAEEDQERTELENEMTLEAPLAFELQAVGQAMAKAIKDLPPEGQPPALLAAIAIINGLRATADATVEGLPDFPPSLSTEVIQAKAQAFELLYRNLPPGTPPEIFLPALGLIYNVDEMVDPLGDDPPTIPHQTTESLINNQIDMLIEYLTQQVLSG
jgi:hypothetical protein